MQVKIARQLKYDGSATDLERLRNELAGAAPVVDEPEVEEYYPAEEREG